jgi:hypothetical protein
MGWIWFGGSFKCDNLFSANIKIESFFYTKLCSELTDETSFVGLHLI